MSTVNTEINTYTNPSYEQYFKAHMLESVRLDLIVANPQKQKIIDGFSEKLSSFREELAHHPKIDFRKSSAIHKKIFEAYNEFIDEVLPNARDYRINIDTVDSSMKSSFFSLNKMKDSSQFSSEDLFIASEVSRFFSTINNNTKENEHNKINQSYSDKVKSGFFKEANNSEYSKKLNSTNEELLQAFPTLYEQAGYKDTFLPQVQQICTDSSISGFTNSKKSATHSDVIQVLENLNKQTVIASESLGIAKECITFNGALGISINHNSDSAASFSHFGFILNAKANMDSITLVHEWTHALDNHIHTQLRRDMQNAGLVSSLNENDPFISSRDAIIPTEETFNSPFAASARDLKNMIREFTFKPSEQISESRQELCKEICTDYWKAAMGNKFFSLPPEVKQEFESIKTLLAIKDVTLNSRLIDGEIAPNNSPNSILTGLLEKHNVSCDGDSMMLRSITPKTNFHTQMTKSFAKFDNILVGQDSEFIMNSRAYSHYAKGEDFQSDAYYTNSVELLARYTESNISPQSSKRDNNMSNTLANKERLLNGTFSSTETKTAQYFEATKESIQQYHTSMQSIFSKVFGPDKIRQIFPQDYTTAVIFNELPNDPNGPQFKKSSPNELAKMFELHNKDDVKNNDLIDFVLKKGKWEYLRNEKTTSDDEPQVKTTSIGQRAVQAFNNLVKSAGNSFMKWLNSDNAEQKKSKNVTTETNNLTINPNIQSCRELFFDSEKTPRPNKNNETSTGQTTIKIRPSAKFQ